MVKTWIPFVPYDKLRIFRRRLGIQCTVELCMLTGEKSTSASSGANCQSLC